MDLPGSPPVDGLRAQIAEEAVGSAVRERCRGRSWQALARALAWHKVSTGATRPDHLEALCTIAESRLGERIDEAVWETEQHAIRGWREFLEARPGESQAAIAAAVLDAREAAARLVAAAYADVLEHLPLADERAAAGRPRPWSRRGRARTEDSLAA